MSGFSRREFLTVSVAGGSLAALSTKTATGQFQTLNMPSLYTEISKPLSKNYRAAAIGWTGHGNFGHGLDKVFNNLPGVEFVAIADKDPEGLAKAGKRNGINHLYSDYREMLKKEKPDIVSVAMRQSVWHEPIVVDCANAGAHIFCEKPIAPDLTAADNMLNACEKNNVLMAVAVQNRLSPAVHVAREIIQSGRIGRLLTMRGRGKEDSRGGGEDLMVLGFHILDLMRFFAGDPEWVFAEVLQHGRRISKADVYEGREPNGPMAGDQIDAMYGFSEGVKGYFETHRNLKDTLERFNLELYCSEGMITLRSLKPVMLLEEPVFNPEKKQKWQPLFIKEWDAIDDKMHWCNQQIVLDLLHAAEQNRQPVASGEDGRWALEMILGTYASHLAGKPVDLPLKNRSHPLG